MKEAKYLREEENENEAKDDGEGEADAELFKKRTHKNAKFGSKPGFGGGMKSFARKKKRIR
jgi:hypothetical protein